MSVITVASVAELRELFATTSSPLRIQGRNTRADRRPASDSECQRVSLAKWNGIERLEADDLTCSVQPGVAVADLQAALAERGVELGFGEQDPGTIGGLFAMDPLGPANLGQPCPRSTILGLEAVLTTSEEFRSGARVVKSVAGFDVHKLFIGSMGRLFVATLLHLKLRPRPQADVPFCTAAMSQAEAVTEFCRLRAVSPPLRQLVLRRDAKGHRIHGRCCGRASEVARLLRDLGLAAADLEFSLRVPADAAHEVVTGNVRPSRLTSLMTLLPDDAPLVVHGGGRFETSLPPNQTDRLLAALGSVDAHGSIAEGADGRRGICSPVDPGSLRLEQGLAQALDPKGLLR